MSKAEELEIPLPPKRLRAGTKEILSPHTTMYAMPNTITITKPKENFWLLIVLSAIHSWYPNMAKYRMLGVTPVFTDYGLTTPDEFLKEATNFAETTPTSTRVVYTKMIGNTLFNHITTIWSYISTMSGKFLRDIYMTNLKNSFKLVMQLPYVHSDISPTNIFIEESTNTTTILDLEQAFTPTFLVHLCRKIEKTGICYNIIKSITTRSNWIKPPTESSSGIVDFSIDQLSEQLYNCKKDTPIKNLNKYLSLFALFGKFIDMWRIIHLTYRYAIIEHPFEEKRPPPFFHESVITAIRPNLNFLSTVYNIAPEKFDAVLAVAFCDTKLTFPKMIDSLTNIHGLIGSKTSEEAKVSFDGYVKRLIASTDEQTTYPEDEYNIFADRIIIETLI